MIGKIKSSIIIGIVHCRASYTIGLKDYRIITVRLFGSIKFRNFDHVVNIDFRTVIYRCLNRLRFGRCRRRRRSFSHARLCFGRLFATAKYD